MLSADAINDEFEASFCKALESHCHDTEPAADAVRLAVNPTLIEAAGAGVVATRCATTSVVRENKS
jgi:hypothetical protein